MTTEPNNKYLEDLKDLNKGTTAAEKLADDIFAITKKNLSASETSEAIDKAYANYLLNRTLSPREHYKEAARNLDKIFGGRDMQDVDGNAFHAVINDPFSAITNHVSDYINTHDIQVEEYSKLLNETEPMKLEEAAGNPSVNDDAEDNLHHPELFTQEDFSQQPWAIGNIAPNATM